MVAFHRQGHSAVIHTEDPTWPRPYGKRMKTVRIIVSSPSSQGAISGIHNGLLPSLTLQAPAPRPPDSALAAH